MKSQPKASFKFALIKATPNKIKSLIKVDMQLPIKVISHRKGLLKFAQPKENPNTKLKKSQA